MRASRSDKCLVLGDSIVRNVLVMQTALCPPSTQSVLETAISHAYPEQGRDNVALYCQSVHPHSLWEGGKTQECCAAKNTQLTHEEQNLVPSHTAKYIFKWIQKWEKSTCYRKILRKYAIKEMDYAILNIFKCVTWKKMLGYNIYSLGANDTLCISKSFLKKTFISLHSGTCSIIHVCSHNLFQNLTHTVARNNRYDR